MDLGMICFAHGNAVLIYEIRAAYTGDPKSSELQSLQKDKYKEKYEEALEENKKLKAQLEEAYSLNLPDHL